MEKKERLSHKITTKNRAKTINMRETSYEGLAETLEAGEDGIYSLINPNKNYLLVPKISITKEDLEEIEPLRQLREAIDQWRLLLKTATGKDAYLIKTTIIEMCRDQYIIKQAYRRTVTLTHPSHSPQYIPLDSDFKITEEGKVETTGISLCKPEVCRAILCNYSILKQDSWEDFEGDLWYLLNDFEIIADIAMKNYPEYEYIIEAKIDGLSNLEIKEELQRRFGFCHTPEYISKLWRQRIPKLIAQAAEDNILNWYYLQVEKGSYRRCTRCGQVKLANNRYFSYNRYNNSGFYSICKECRNKASREKRLAKMKEVQKETSL